LEYNVLYKQADKVVYLQCH